MTRLTSEAVEVLRDRKMTTPGAANNRFKVIRRVLKFEVRSHHVTSNAARDVEKLKIKST